MHKEYELRWNGVFLTVGLLTCGIVQGFFLVFNHQWLPKEVIITTVLGMLIVSGRLEVRWIK